MTLAQTLVTTEKDMPTKNIKKLSSIMYSNCVSSSPSIIVCKTSCLCGLIVQHPKQLKYSSGANLYLQFEQCFPILHDPKGHVNVFKRETAKSCSERKITTTNQYKRIETRKLEKEHFVSTSSTIGRKTTKNKINRTRKQDISLTQTQKGQAHVGKHIGGKNSTSKTKDK